MQSLHDEVRVSLLSADEHRHPPASTHPSSSSTSLSSATIFDSDDPARYDAAFAHSRLSSAASTDTLIAKHLPSIWAKLPFARTGDDYEPIAAGAGSHKSRSKRRGLQVVGVLLLAALLLGVGVTELHRTLELKSSDAHEAYLASLHDDDSAQDKAVIVPTFPRPLHPTEAKEILPFGLHHDDQPPPPPLRAPSEQAPNRRQLAVVPAQSVLLGDAACLDEWMTNGSVCDALVHAYRRRPELTSVDLLYTWVNGSDWRHSSASWMHAYRPTGRWQEYAEADLFASSSQPALGRRGLDASRRLVTAKTPVENRFRDHEELRYSMRSAAKHLHGLKTIHIVSPDFSAPYHLQPGAKTQQLKRRSTEPPFTLDVDQLAQGFLGLPSQLRRVQDIGTDRFTTDEGQVREGQVPQWLALNDTARVLAGQDAESESGAWLSLRKTIVKLFALKSDRAGGKMPPTVRVHHDWNAFTDNWLVSRPDTPQERSRRDDYRRAALPTFNSMAVEAMLGDQPGLADSFVYANDDFFLLDDVSVADVTSPLFGPVLRLDYNLVVKGEKSPEATPGEWSSLWHTNWLLDQRFGRRNRPYIQHVHKSFSKALLHETRMGWAAEHARLGINRFRNAGDNIVTHFLAYYNMVERHREALLWSFFLLRLDEDGDGIVSGERERRSAMLAMGLTEDQVAEVESSTRSVEEMKVVVKLAKRTTLAADGSNRALVKAGWPVPLKSTYVFTSQDGYPLGDVSDRVIYRREAPSPERRSTHQPRDRWSAQRGESGYYGWPNFVDDPKAHPTNEWYNRRFERPACELDLHRCFVKPFVTGDGVRWEEVFKHFAYQDVACGDCLIHHLVGQSGSQGLAAFLPDKERMYEGTTDSKSRSRNPVPHLPLSTTWNASAVDPAAEAEQACFSVACVLANSGFGNATPLREFAARLIQRYAYTIADTPLRFDRLETLYSSTKIMHALQTAALRPSALDRFNLQPNATVQDADAWIQSQRRVDVQRPAFVCVNDDITDKWVDQVGVMFTSWMQGVWPDKPAWER